jgi:hypothetical protein
MVGIGYQQGMALEHTREYSGKPRRSEIPALETPFAWGAESSRMSDVLHCRTKENRPV